MFLDQTEAMLFRPGTVPVSILVLSLMTTVYVQPACHRSCCPWPSVHVYNTSMSGAALQTTSFITTRPAVASRHCQLPASASLPSLMTLCQVGLWALQITRALDSTGHCYTSDVIASPKLTNVGLLHSVLPRSVKHSCKELSFRNQV